MTEEELKDKNEDEHSSTINEKVGIFKKTVEYFSTYQAYNIISVIVGVISIAIIVLIAVDECNTCFKRLKTYKNLSTPVAPRKFWVFGRNIESGYLKNVFLILDRLGYEYDSNSTEWDLLWAHDYPFRILQSKLQQLKPHQKVNHIPGCGYLTNKVDLATSNLKYIPPAFKLPADKNKLLEYAKSHPKASFVQKNNDHRNIRIENLADINMNQEGTFIQEFVDRPLLVSGYKFDIGIYTVITSVDPLRIYVYNGDALLRFCPVKYYPFDPNNLDKYVVGDDYLPTWEVAGLDYYYNTLGFGMRESLNAYLCSKKKDPLKIWEQIEDAIRTVVLAKEQQIVEVINRFPSKANFFEMMRFDFVVDEDLNVFLMEANMSPNLSSAHFPLNQLLFEQVIFNLFGLVGVGTRLQNNRLSSRSNAEERMQTSDKNIAVFPTQCASVLCRGSCMSPVCQLCRPCLTLEMRAVLVQAHHEHMNRGDYKRIFPSPTTQETAAIMEELEDFSAENRLHLRWFHGKCLLDQSWC